MLILVEKIELCAGNCTQTNKFAKFYFSSILDYHRRESFSWLVL